MRFLYIGLDKNKASDLLIYKELERLMGKNNRHFFMLILMLVLTIGAVSFAVANVYFLKERMDHPFMSWIRLPIDSELSKQRYELEEKFEDPVIQDSFALNALDYYYFEWYRIVLPTTDGVTSGTAWAGSIPLDDDNLTSVFDDSKVRTMKTKMPAFEDFVNDSDAVILLHQRLIEDLELDLDNLPEFCWLQIFNNDLVIANIPVKIGGVLERFPLDINVLVSNKLRQKIKIHSDILSADGRTDKNNDLTISGFVSEGLDVSSQLVSDLAEYVKGHSGIESFHLYESYVQESFGAIQSFEVKARYIIQDEDHFDLTIEAVNRRLQNLADSLSKIDGIKRGYYLSTNAFRYNVERSGIKTLDNPQGYIFRFSSLDRMQDFSRYMYQVFGAIVSMENIETRDNFRRVVSATFVSISVLVIFGIFGIFFYLDGVLVRHLEHSRKTIGAIKAFGAGNKKMTDIYSKVLIRYMGMGIILAFGLVWILTLPFPDNWFRTIHWAVLLITALVFGMSYFLVNRSLGKILTLSPGELIKND